jgi:hypothetical protein
MPRTANMFRTLAIASDIAAGLHETDIAEKYAKLYGLGRPAIYAAMKTLLHTWATQKPKIYQPKLWGTTPVTEARMKALAEALATGEAGEKINERFAQEWEVTPAYVRRLVATVKASLQGELLERSKYLRLRYIDRIEAFVAKYAHARYWPPVGKAIERLALIKE